MNATPHAERRHFNRIHFDAGGLLAADGRHFTVTVRDLSLKGALVDLPAIGALAAGAACVLTVPLAGGGDAAITMTSEVAHVQGVHAGLVCRSIDLDSATHLRQVLQLNLGDPALLERDLKALAVG